MWLFFFILAVLSDVPLPEDKSATTPVCDDSAELIISLMTDEAAVDVQSTHCSNLGTYVSEGTEAPIADQCACYTADGVDPTSLYSKACRLTTPTLYLVSESAMYCNNDYQLIAETDPQAVTTETTTFDLANWEGVAGTSIGQGQMLRKTFVVNDAGEDVKYLAFTLDTIPNDAWTEADDKVVEIGVNNWQVGYVANLTASTTESHTVILSLDRFSDGEANDEHRFTVGFTTNVASTDPTYWVSMTSLGVYTRKQVGVMCRGTEENVGTTFYPEFDQDASGFFDINSGSSIDSEKVTFTLRVPRYYYDMTVDFDGGNGFAGFNDQRTYSQDVDDLTKTYWGWGGYADEACGYEDITAQIPWTVLNENGGGNLQLVEAWNNGTYVDTDDTYYKFAGTVLMTGHEHVYTTETDDTTGASRTWETERSLEWRVPFVIRMQRIVLVATTMDVNPPDLMINYVAALTEYVQADTVYDLSSSEYRAFVTMDIKTKTLFPYILIPGYNEDDPPKYFESMTAPLDEGDGWYPPQITFTATNYPDVTVEANITFISEDRSQCTFIDDSDIRANDDRECEQLWRIDVIPLNGACYIDGEYQIEFGARCFYDKPTCLFNTDVVTGEVENSVVLTLDVVSTNMCPELVQDVAIEGELCDTGRTGYMRCGDVAIEYPCGYDQDHCDGPPHPTINTYFQNDDAYFFVEVTSDDAKVIYSEITDIWTTPTSSLDPTVPNDPNLFTTQIYTAGVANSLTWTNGNTGLTENVRPIVWQVQNSDYFADIYSNQGTGATDYGNFAGFVVFLDERIFPAPTDGFYDVTFTVQVKVWYEGWGDQKVTRRQLVEMTLPLNGNDQMMLQKPVSVQRRPIEMISTCSEMTNMRWAISTPVQSEQAQLTADMAVLLESNDFTFEGQHEINNEFVVVFSTERQDLWERLDSVLFSRPRTFQTSSFSRTTSVTCLDVPATHTPSSLQVVQCSASAPCAMYDGMTLDEYASQSDDNADLTPVIEDDSSSAVLSLLLVALLAVLNL